MTIHLVDSIPEVLRLAFEGGPVSYANEFEELR
jgi:hypothetical protein